MHGERHKLPHDVWGDAPALTVFGAMKRIIGYKMEIIEFATGCAPGTKSGPAGMAITHHIRRTIQLSCSAFSFGMHPLPATPV